MSTTPHPTPEEWMDLLYPDEAGIEGDRIRLRDHVAGCPACQAQLRQLREARSRLNQWTLDQDTTLTPQPVESLSGRGRVPAGFRSSWLPWGAAAALLVGGVCLGLAWERGNTVRMRAELLPVLRAELVAEWRARPPAPRPGNAAPVDAISEHALERVLAHLEAGRAEDRQALASVLREMDQRNRQEFGQLRQDLETLALVANDRFESTRSTVSRLLAVNHVTSGEPSTSAPIPPASASPQP